MFEEKESKVLKEGNIPDYTGDYYRDTRSSLDNGSDAAEPHTYNHSAAQHLVGTRSKTVEQSQACTLHKACVG